MAYICTKDIKCEQCNSYRYDDDRNCMCCFAKQDEEKENLILELKYILKNRNKY